MKIIERVIVCPSCQGTGYINQPSYSTTASTQRKCPACMGNKTIIETIREE